MGEKKQDKASGNLHCERYVEENYFGVDTLLRNRQHSESSIASEEGGVNTMSHTAC